MKRNTMKSGVFWLTLLLTAMVGCGDGSSGTNEPTAPDEETVDDPSTVDSSDPADSDPSDPSDSEPSDVDPTEPDPSDVEPSDPDPTEPNLEGTFCSAQPVREDGLELTNLWEMFRSAREEGCYLESYLENTEGDDQWVAGETLLPTDTDWSCEDNDCRWYKGQLVIGWEIEADEFGWYSSPDLALGTLKVWEVDDEQGDNKWAVEVDYIRNGSTATYRLERLYDASGNIHFERTYFQITIRKEITNTYEQGRLVAQETVEQLGNGNAATRTRTWTYDADGQMVGSTYQRASGPLYSVTFEYDTQGRVIGLERSEDGVRFLAQSWSFEDESVASRTSVIEGSIYYDGADSFQPQIRDGFSNHWDDAGVRMGRGGCEQVPTSLWHGYPESDEVYVLGWKREDVPNSIGFGYGYNGFGFNYGDYSWMGHGGIATSYESSYMMEPTRVETAITYDAQGRMIEETVESESNWGEEMHFSSVRRSRLFEGDLIMEDSVTAESNSGEMLNFENQTLSFVYDSSGQLVERSAQSDGITNNQTTWTYDEEGRVNEHAIYGLYWNSEGDSGEQLPLTGAFRDVYTLDDQTRERRREKKNIQDGSWILQILTSVTQSETGETEQDNYSNSYRIRDFERVLTEVGYGEVAEPSMFLRLKRDSSNLVEESGRLGSGGMGAVFKRYTHQCSDE